MDKVVHFEIPADSLERCQKFYQKVFGWKVEKWPIPEGSEYQGEYYGIHTVEVDEKMMPKESGAINGGMTKRNPIMKSPVVTINVKNIDESMEEIRKNGGEVLGEKIKVADMGYVGYFKDTEGNILGLWQSIIKS